MFGFGKKKKAKNRHIDESYTTEMTKEEVFDALGISSDQVQSIKDLCILSFFIDSNGELAIESGWDLDAEPEMAELLFNLNSGQLLETILETMKVQAEKNGKTKQFELITQFMYDMFAEQVAESDTPAVRPSQIFSHNRPSI